MKLIFSHIINSVLSRIDELLSSSKLNISKTLYINFRSLPIKQAIRLPIYVYGKIKIFNLYGSIELHSRVVKRGSIKIGNKKNGVILETPKVYFRNEGKIIFMGDNIICNGASINNKGGTLIFGEKSYIGENVRIVCSSSIKIGKGTRIAHDSQLIDSNFHYLIDLRSLTTTSPRGAIIIGNYCWIANRTTIQKGTILPNDTITTSNSLLNKDYSKIEPYSIVGGIPAKVIKSGIRRVFNPINEIELNEIFKPINDNGAYKLTDKLDIDEYCYM